MMLIEALAEFMEEWDANQRLKDIRGVGLGVCDLCGRQRYLLYNIMTDAQVCSSRCGRQYARFQERTLTYARQK